MTQTSSKNLASSSTPASPNEVASSEESAVALVKQAGTAFKPLDAIAIEKILPHRYPFLMVDRIVDMVDNERCVGIKNVTYNEPFFTGHFPGRPVMPGVMILEAMAQCGAILALCSSEGIPAGSMLMLTGVDEMRWKRQVVPGDTLRLELEFIKKRRPIWVIKGSAFVGDKLVVTGVLSAAEVE